MLRSRLNTSTMLVSDFVRMQKLVECRMLMARVEDMTRRAGIT